MPTSDAAAEARRRPNDLIAAILDDHAQIKALFRQAQSATSTDAKRSAFDRLVRKIAVHETAEEEVVRPLTRQAPGGDAVADARIAEESEGKAALAKLESMGVDHPDFDDHFQMFRSKVVAHAEHEESDEHPRIEEAVDEDRLRKLAKAFRAAEAIAPTRPHPGGPTSAAGNAVVGPVVAIADRARDAVRSALRSVGS